MPVRLIAPSDPLGIERQLVREAANRVERAEVRFGACPELDTADEMGAAHDELEVVLVQLRDAAKEVYCWTGELDCDLKEAMFTVGEAGAVNGEVAVADLSSAVSDHLRSWGYTVVPSPKIVAEN